MIYLTTLYYFLDKQITKICNNNDAKSCKNYEDNVQKNTD